MRATLCALAFGLPFLLPGSLLAQYKSDHLNVANTNPPPAPFREALRVAGYPEPPQSLNLTHSEVRRLQVWATRMESGPRDAFDRVFSKQEEMRDLHIADIRPRFIEDGRRWPLPYTEHELRYYGKYIAPSPPSVLTPSLLQEQRHELRTPGGSQFPLRDRP